ncbi:SUF system NifU family Fe-S cluster assembly protein [soil metagenome]
MSDISDLYQEVIIDHSRSPRNCYCLENANHHAEGFNPLCGDKLTLYVRVSNDIIEEASFIGSGCAISTASASLMTEALKGKTQAEAETLFQAFHQLLTSKIAADVDKLGKLIILQGVREFPSRVKCATLAWHTLHAALLDENKIISTE